MGGNLDWQDIARRFAERLPATVLDQRALKHLNDAAHAVRIVACSGGADSIAALLLLWVHCADDRSRLHVAHFNHRLRGAASDGDAAFVEAVCRSLGLNCHQGEWTSPPQQVSEADARDARREFFAKVCAETGAIQIITGHHLDDVAETLLMRVGRGSGVEGLCAPRSVSGFAEGVTFVRPLLTLGKKELCSALKAAGAFWREDHTNAEGLFVRNRIRNEVLPLLDDALGRSFAQGAGRVRTLLEEADEALFTIAGRVLAESLLGGRLRLDQLRKQPRAIVRKALELWLDSHGLRANLNAVALDRLLDETIAGTQITRRSIGDRFIEENADGLLQIEEPRQDVSAYDIRLTAGTETFFGWGRLAVDRYLLSDEQREYIFSRSVNPAKEAWISVPEDVLFDVRNWRPGDQYQPLGMRHRTKLQDQFVNRKVSVAERTRLPVVTVGGAIAWCPSLPPAENFRITKETRTAVRLTYVAS